MTYKNVPPRRTDEFRHFGITLSVGGEGGPNYPAWPLAYIENHRPIPAKWRNAFLRELQSPNTAYVDNINAQIAKHGIVFGT